MATVTTQFCGREQVAGTSYFNGNAFPGRVHPLADPCADRFALLMYCSGSVPVWLEHDARLFLRELEAARTGDTPLLDGHEFLAVYRGMGYRAALLGTLNALKSFLDALGPLWMALIDGRSHVRGFHRGWVGGDQLSGGSIINWLRNAPRDASSRRHLADIVEKHSRAWITEAVAYRDILVHGRELRELRDLHVRLRSGCEQYCEADIVWPTMPNGMLVAAYCASLFNRSDALHRETVPLLPEVDLRLLCTLDGHAPLFPSEPTRT